MADIIEFTGETTLPIPADKILQQAVGKLEDVVVCGWDTNGDLYLASSDSKIKEILFLLERAKFVLMDY